MERLLQSTMNKYSESNDQMMTRKVQTLMDQLVKVMETNKREQNWANSTQRGAGSAQTDKADPSIGQIQMH
jgi:hypothetical protein